MPPKAAAGGRSSIAHSTSTKDATSFQPSGGNIKTTPDHEDLQEATAPSIPPSGGEDSTGLLLSDRVDTEFQDQQFAASGTHAQDGAPLSTLPTRGGSLYQQSADSVDFSPSGIKNSDFNRPQNISNQEHHPRTSTLHAQTPVQSARLVRPARNVTPHEVPIAADGVPGDFPPAVKAFTRVIPGAADQRPLHPWQATKPLQTTLTTPASERQNISSTQAHPPLRRPIKTSPHLSDQERVSLAAERAFLAQGFYSAQEQEAIRRSHAIEPEARSQDTDGGNGVRTRQGYKPNRFVKADTDEDLISEDESDEDDDESVALGSDTNSQEALEERYAREDIVANAFKKQSTFAISSSETLEPIVLVRRTGRSRYMEMLLNSFIFYTVILDPTAEDVCLFLKLIKLLPQECLYEIYSNMARSILIRSKELYLFLFKVIKTYLPAQGPHFNYIHLKNKKKKEKETSSKPAEPKAEDEPGRRAKPTVVKPVLRSIEDIHDITFRFLNLFKLYEHEHKKSKYDHDSLFGCLTPDQQATMCDMTNNTIASIEALDTEGQLDLFRGLFGLKSSAAVIDELSQLEFQGDGLSPASWATFKTRFQKVLNLAPAKVRPLENELARRFVYACPIKMLKADVQSKKPKTLACAMDTILATLNDPGFLRSYAAKTSKTTSTNRHDKESQFLREVQTRDQGRPNPGGAARPFQPKALDGTARPFQHKARDVQPAQPYSGLKESTPAYAPAQGPPRQNSGFQQSGFQQSTVPRIRKPIVPCERCKRTDGHDKNACISKHDLEGNKLQPLEPDVYAKNKERYFILKEQIKAGVLDDDSDTSDEELRRQDWFEDNVYEDDDEDVDCVCDDFDFSCDSDIGDIIVDSVPAPSLLDSGDVESNPGPLSRKAVRQFAEQKRIYSLRQHSNFEMLAWLLLQKVVFAHTAEHHDSQEPLFSAAVVLSMTITAVVVMIFARRPSPINEECIISSTSVSTPIYVTLTFFVFVATVSYSILLQLQPDPGVSCFWALHITLCFVLAARLVGIEPNPGPDTADASSPYWMIIFTLCVAAVSIAWGADILRIAGQRTKIFQPVYNQKRFTIKGIVQKKSFFDIPQRFSSSTSVSKASSACVRCEKADGHDASCCISKHDVRGNRLQSLDPAVYAENKRRHYRFKFPSRKERTYNVHRVVSAPVVHSEIIQSTVTFATLFHSILSESQLRWFTFNGSIITIFGTTDADLQNNIMIYHTCLRQFFAGRAQPMQQAGGRLASGNNVGHVRAKPMSDTDSDASTSDAPPNPRLVDTEPNPGPSDHELSSSVTDSEDDVVRRAPLEDQWLSRNQTIFPIHPPPFVQNGDSNFHWIQSFPGITFWSHMFLQSLPAPLRNSYVFIADDVKVTGITVKECDRNVSNLQRFYRHFLMHCARFIPPYPGFIEFAPPVHKRRRRAERIAPIPRLVGIELNPGPCALNHLVVPPPPRLVCVEPNPGPQPLVTLESSKHRPPSRAALPSQLSDDTFAPRPRQSAVAEWDLSQVMQRQSNGIASNEPPCVFVSPVIAEFDVSAVLLGTMPPLLETNDYSSSDDSEIAAVIPNHDDDSSVTSDPDLYDIVNVIDPLPDLLSPPKFIGFLCPPNSASPPPDKSATICAVDSMCLGQYSIISGELVHSLRLPTTPFQRVSRTATGATVHCSALASFWIMVRVNKQWQIIPCQALVWERTSQPFLLCNTWALSTGFIDMVQPNATRCDIFGLACFTIDWETVIV
jgi:hypothetical protein